MSSPSVHDTHELVYVRVYITVFVALAALTLITVTVSYLPVSTATAIVIALVIATVKGSLVVCYFMHLISEKKLIYTTLVLTAVFLGALFLLTLSSSFNQILKQ